MLDGNRLSVENYFQVSGLSLGVTLWLSQQLLYFLACVLKNIILWKGEPLAQS